MSISKFSFFFQFCMYLIFEMSTHLESLSYLRKQLYVRYKSLFVVGAPFTLTIRRLFAPPHIQKSLMHKRILVHFLLQLVDVFCQNVSRCEKEIMHLIPLICNFFPKKKKLKGPIHSIDLGMPVRRDLICHLSLFTRVQ